MNKKLLVLALALIGAGACPFEALASNNTKKDIGLTLEVGADMVSSYLWRGYNIGGLSIQPSVTLDWNGLYICGWGSIGADNWTFEDMSPEMDITIGYDNYGVQIDLTHLYYFGGDPFFPRGGFKPEPEEESSSTMEAHIGFHLGDIIEAVPLSIDWHTTVFGADYYINEAGEAERAWSTYIQVGYDLNLPLDFVLGAKVGITPWKGLYSNYNEVWKNAKTVAINNVNLRLERAFEWENLYLGVWGECMLNCYGIDKNNLKTELTNAINDFESDNNSYQRLNWCVGVSLYFENEW